MAILFEYVHATRAHLHRRQRASARVTSTGGWATRAADWDGDTLVVDVVHFNDETWFDRAGNFHSDELHVVERYTPIDPDHIAYEVTIEDPKVFTRPWKMSMPLYRRQEKNAQLLEYECYAFEWEKYYPYPRLW